MTTGMKTTAKPKSRAARWADAVSDARDALDNVNSAREELYTALEEIKAVQSEYADWLGNLSDNLLESATGEKLTAVTDLDFEVEIDLDEMDNLLTEAEGMELPVGYGRD